MEQMVGGWQAHHAKGQHHDGHGRFRRTNASSMGGKLKLGPPPSMAGKVKLGPPPSSMGGKVKLGPSPSSDSRIFRASSS
jgi:hypothetical protein